MSAWLFRPSCCQAELYTREGKDRERNSDPACLDDSTPGPWPAGRVSFPNTQMVGEISRANSLGFVSVKWAFILRLCQRHDARETLSPRGAFQETKGSEIGAFATKQYPLEAEI